MTSARAGTVGVGTFAVGIDDVPLPVRARPPPLGEHTGEIVADLAGTGREPRPA
jgi:crotonobetainyl-CoA:carnitine CoA-transferase CaiB-like acyl-CoA transferase